MTSPHPSTPASSPNCWRLRYPIPGYAAAGSPVLVGGAHAHDPDEIDIIVAGQSLTVPPYYLTPPATRGWSIPKASSQ